MQKDQLATHLVTKMTPSEIISAFNCDTLADNVVARLVEQSTSPEDFVERFNATCQAQAAEIERLRAETERGRADVKRLAADRKQANKSIRDAKQSTRDATQTAASLRLKLAGHVVE